jgi:hypothetical protein
MGSYTDLTIDGFVVIEAKSYVFADAMTIFRESNKKTFERKISEDSEELETAIVYACKTSHVIDRLNVMGFTMQRIREDFEEIRQEEIEKLNSWLSEDGSEYTRKELNLYKSLTFDAYAKALKEVMATKEHYWGFENNENLDPITQHIQFNEDYHFGFLGRGIQSFIRLACELVSPDSEVIQDITELVSNGYYGDDEPVCQNAINSLTSRHPENSQRIILTEGSIDAHILKESLPILYPHIFEYYSFLEFKNTKSQGGAGNLVNIVKAFAATGITNRIIAIFDNDSAAFDARRSLESISLPPNIAICSYPDLEFLNSYPTIGPGGMVSLEVNGLAASIELYLGQDVLTDDGEENFPVQWKGYIEGVGKYQGEVMHKSTIHRKFQSKLEKSKLSNDFIQNGDWTGLRAIWNVIFHAFDFPEAQSGSRGFFSPSPHTT